MTMPMQWALRRRMMMAALGSGIDVAALSITYTGAYTDYGMVTMSDGARYRLLAFTASGTLSIEQPVNCEVCIVGGGANGRSGASAGANTCAGGAGAYMKNQVIEAFDGGEVVVGAAQGASSIGGVSVNAVSGQNGGTGAGGRNAGTGDGLSKYPFGDDSYELWAGKPHCAGGGAGGFSKRSGADEWDSYSYGDGGTNGSNGSAQTYRRKSGTENAPGGSGGLYGGGNGGNATSNGANATYYGSGAGGGGYYRYYSDEIRNGGSGYQGIVYIRIPEEPPAYISDLPLGTLINIGTDGGEGAANYEIADINNFVSGGVVLVRKNIHSKSAFGYGSAPSAYPGNTLDNKMTSIYNSLPEKLKSKIMDATFALEGSGSITRKVFALTYTMAGYGANNGTTEGKALQRYNSNANRKKTLNGSAWSWWLSSRIVRETSYPRDVTTAGAVDYNRPDFSTGVVPAFVIPSKTPYDPTPNTDGSYNLFQNTTISDLPLGALINVGTDGGAGAPNYEIADKDNLVSGGVVLVRKNIYSKSQFGSNTNYPNSTLDNLIKATIYNEMPQKLRDKMMDVSFNLSGSGDITRKMFALTYTMAGFGNNNGVAEGKALQLYTSDAGRVKTLNGSAAGWWLSSQHSSEYVWRVFADGSAVSDRPTVYTYGAVPAFVIPGDTLGKLTPNTDGSYNLIL